MNLVLLLYLFKIYKSRRKKACMFLMRMIYFIRFLVGVYLIEDLDRLPYREAKATRTAGSNAENPSKSRGPYRGYGLATLLPY